MLMNTAKKNKKQKIRKKKQLIVIKQKLLLLLLKGKHLPHNTETNLIIIIQQNVSKPNENLVKTTK